MAAAGAPSFQVVGAQVPSSIDGLIGRFEADADAPRSSAVLAPTGLVATVVRPMITLAWIAPAGGPFTYLIEVGSASTLADLGVFAVAGTTVSAPAPDGTYYVRIRTVDSQGNQSQNTSNEVVVTLKPSANPLIFDAPQPVPGQVGLPYFFSFCGLPDENGANCAGSANLTGGVPPYHFQLDTFGGFPPIGLVLAANGALTGAPRSAVTNHTFKVCAVDTTGVNSCPTVTMTIAPAGPPPCTAPPAPPTGVAAAADGTTLTVSWNRSDGATSYVLEAGTSPGASNLFNGDVGDVSSLTAPGVPAGTLYIRVRARNGCGTSAVSTGVSVTVGGSPPGNRVSNVRIWLTGCAGQAPEPMPGWVNCSGYITMDVDADIRTGWIQVVMRFPVEGSFYNGQVQVGVGRIRRNVRVDIRNSYVSRCPAVPYHTFVGVSDGRQGLDPGAARFTTVDVVISNCS